MKNCCRPLALLFIVVFLTTCVKEEQVVLDPTLEMNLFSHVKVLADADFNDHILAVDSVNYTLTANPALIDQYDIDIGDIIVSSVGYGLLRRVESISHTADRFFIQTSQATLEDAVEQGQIMYKQTLSPQMIDSVVYFYQGVKLAPSTFEKNNNSVDFDVNVDLGSSVVLSGDISLASDIVFEMEVRRFLRLTKVNFGFENTSEANIELTAGGSFDFNPRIRVSRVHFTPIIIPTVIPIVITPILDIYAGLDGKSEASMATSLEVTFNYETGIVYERGDGWNTYSETDTNVDFSPPQLTLEASVAAYMQPEFSMLVYGVLGAYLDSRVYSEIEVTPLVTPWWSWYAGYRVGIGARARIFGIELFDVDYPELFANKWLIANSGDDPPSDFTGFVNGVVRDAVTSNSVENVNVRAYQNQSLINNTQTGSNGGFSLELPSNQTYRIEFSKQGYIDVDYNGVIVETDQVTYLETVLKVDEAYAGNGTISGRIIDAFDGQGIPAADIIVRAGMNNQEGSIVTTATSQSNGNYSISNLPAGSYTLDVRKSNYNAAFASVVSIGNQTNANQNVTLTPLIDDDEIRIILDWGQSPSDLDSHLTGPIPGSSNRFHIYYSNKTFMHGGVVHATLDYDVVNSYGPETITIYEQTSGVYRYSVHDFTNSDSTTSSALSNSNARVRVYFGANLIQTFNVPGNTPGTLWTVFELNGSNITPINNMSFESSPGSITKNSDAGLIRRLPEKSKH